MPHSTPLCYVGGGEGCGRLWKGSVSVSICDFLPLRPLSAERWKHEYGYVHVAYDSKVLLRYKVVKSSERSLSGAISAGGRVRCVDEDEERKEGRRGRTDSESSRSRNNTSSRWFVECLYLMNGKSVS